MDGPLSGKMDKSHPINVKILEEVSILLLIEYAQMEKVRFPQYKAER